MTIRTAIVGLGTIARAQHLPAIAANPKFSVAGAIVRRPTEAEFPVYTSLEELIAHEGVPDAIAICTPTASHYEFARDALSRGIHVLLEKPPCSSVAEVEDLAALASSLKLTLFTSWHCQHNEAVRMARELLANEEIESFEVDWREDVERWHPGQEWMWQDGGMGVFDMGSNALSILTHILPMPLTLTESTLYEPANRNQPVAAEMRIRHGGIEGSVRFDWRSEANHWRTKVRTKSGRDLSFPVGGAKLVVDGVETVAKSSGEYPGIYQTFAELIESGRSYVDTAALGLTLDALRSGARHKIADYSR